MIKPVITVQDVKDSPQLVGVVNVLKIDRAIIDCQREYTEPTFGYALLKYLDDNPTDEDVVKFLDGTEVETSTGLEYFRGLKSLVVFKTLAMFLDEADEQITMTGLKQKKGDKSDLSPNKEREAYRYHRYTSNEFTRAKLFIQTNPKLLELFSYKSNGVVNRIHKI